jgi:hypothetical protein
MDTESRQAARPRRPSARRIRITSDDLIALGSAGAVIGLIAMQIAVHL